MTGVEPPQAEASSTVPHPRALVAVLAVLVLVPLVAVLFAQLANIPHRVLSVGDLGALELAVRDALDGGRLVGVHSRFGWHHPGPLYLYLLVPFYLLGGQTTGSLFVGAAILVLLAGVATAVVLTRVVDRPGLQVVGLLLLGLGIAHFHEEGRLGLSGVWNPVVAVLPFALFSWLSVALSRGDWRGVAPLLLLGSFLVQTHVGYGVVVVATTGVALAGWLLAYRGGERLARPSMPWLGAGLGLVVLVSLPPLWEQLTAEQGNMGRIIDFFLAGDQERAPWSESWSRAALGLSQPFARPGGGQEDGWVEASTGRIAVAVMLMAAVPSSAVFAWRRRDRTALALAAVAGVQLVAVLVSVAGIRGSVVWYQTLWVPFVGVLAGTAVAAALMPELARWRLPPLLGTGGAVAALVAGVALAGVGLQTANEQSTAVRAESEQRIDTMGRIVQALEDKILAAGDEPVVLTTEHAGKGLLGMALVALDKRGVQVRVDEQWAYKFAGAVPYAPAEGHVLSLASRPSSASRQVVRVANIVLIEDRTWTVDASMLGRARAVGARGRVEVLFDGVDPVAEKISDTDAWLVLDEPGATLTLQVPGTGLVGIRVSARPRDVIALSGSMDGFQFTPLGQVGARIDGRRGPPWSYYLNDQAVGWRFLRLEASDAESKVVLGEVTPLLEGIRWVGPVPGDLVESGPAAAQGADPVPLPDRVFTVPQGVVLGVRLERAADTPAWLVGRQGEGAWTSLERLAKTPRSVEETFLLRHPGGWDEIGLAVADGAPTPPTVTVLMASGLQIGVGSPQAREVLAQGWTPVRKGRRGPAVWAQSSDPTLLLPLVSGRAARLSLGLEISPQDGEPLNVYVGGRLLASVQRPARGESVNLQIPADRAAAQTLLTLQLPFEVGPDAESSARLSWVAVEQDFDADESGLLEGSPGQ